MKRLLPSIVLTIAFLAVAAGLKYAESAGLVGDDMAQRVVQVMIGLMLAASPMSRPNGSVPSGCRARPRPGCRRPAGSAAGP